MEVIDVKRQIQSKQLDKFYIFTGEENKAQNVYIHKICEVGNATLKWIDSISEVYNKRGNSLVNTKYCYVCINDTEFIKYEKAWDSIEQILGNNILIFIVTDLDKRSKFYKRFSDRIVEFKLFDKVVLRRYIQKDVDMSDRYCDILIDVCEGNYNRILLELDKVLHYHDVHRDVDVLKTLLDDGTIYKPPTDEIFNFVDAVLSHKVRLSFHLLEECERLGEPTLRLLLVLYNNVKHLLQVQSCPSKDVMSATGLSKWEIGLVKDKCGIYSNGDLVHAMRVIQQTEYDIKCGQIDDDIAMRWVLVNIF